MERLSNKIVLITGANSGIGRCLTECLVGKGMTVVGIARHVEKIKALAEELKSKPGKLLPLQCDLSNQTDIMRTLEWIEKNLGAINILINNAAINMDVTMHTGEMDDWRKIFDVNFLGLTCMTKEVLKLMKKKECLRSELAQLESNIKVISIAPGLVETEMTAQWLRENPRLALKPKDVSDCVLFALQTPDTVLIKDLTVTPIRETM